MAASRQTQGVERQTQRLVLSLLSVGRMTGSELAVGGTERSQMNSFGSRSDDRRSSEVNLLVDSFWLVAVTLGRSTSEQSTVTGSPGETAFLLRKAARRYRSRRLVEGDLDFLVDFSDFFSSAGNGWHPFFSEQKLKEKIWSDTQRHFDDQTTGHRCRADLNASCSK